MQTNLFHEVRTLNEFETRILNETFEKSLTSYSILHAEKSRKEHVGAHCSWSEREGLPYPKEVCEKAGLIKIINRWEFTEHFDNCYALGSVYHFKDYVFTDMKKYRERMDNALKNIKNESVN